LSPDPIKVAAGFGQPRAEVTQLARNLFEALGNAIEVALALIKLTGRIVKK
jgi:hypothetical protein